MPRNPDIMIRGEGLHPKVAASAEWWYYHGHLEAGVERFGFHLCFFRVGTAGFRLGGVLPLPFILRTCHFAHFAFTDFGARRFVYGEARGSRRFSAEASPAGVDLRQCGWAACVRDEGHRVRAGLDDCRVDVNLRPVKPAGAHARAGWLGRFRCPGPDRGYVACSRMAADGRVRAGGRDLSVTGEGWMEHEWGDPYGRDQWAGWDWLALQLDGHCELMIYRVRDREGRRADCSMLVWTGADGTRRVIEAGGFEAEPVGHWRSPRTGTTYPVAWRVRIPELQADLAVEPRMAFHEIDSRCSSWTIYWEGPVVARGSVGGRSVRGRGFVELVGHEAMPGHHGVLVHGTRSISLRGLLANEWRWRAGVRQTSWTHADASPAAVAPSGPRGCA